MEIITGLEKALSHQRLQSFRKSDIESLDTIIQRYLWNVTLCEALYPSLHFFEITLRNFIHETLSTEFGEKWFLKNDLLLQDEAKKIQNAIESLKRQKKTDSTGRIIAELHFGFWTSLFDVRYERNLWHKGNRLRNTFPNLINRDRTRQTLSKRLHRIRQLRNRIFHYEPIWHWQDLSAQHEELLEAIGWMSFEIKEQVLKVDRFSSFEKRIRYVIEWQ